MMLQRIYTVLFFISFLMLVSSCEHQPKELIVQNPGNNDTGTVTGCSKDTTYFVNVILPLLSTKCASEDGCHSAKDQKEGIILDSYNNIMNTTEMVPGKPFESEIYKYITSTSKPMPPPGSKSGSLTAAQIKLVRDWISQGAKNNYCKDACDTTVFTYSGAVVNILNKYNCYSCHASGTTKIATYNELKVLVDNGKLIGALKHQAPATNFMPSATTYIAACDLRKIEKWIENGALNN